MSPLKSWSERRKEADAEGAKFAPLNPDRYSFVIPDAAKVEHKDGNARFQVNPAVESGERAKARVFHTFYVSDKPAGMRFFFEQMDALGLGPLFDGDPTDDQIAQALKGRRFTAEVFNETWEGKERQKLRKFAPAVGSAPAGGSGPGAGPAAAQGPSPVAQSFGQAPVQQQPPVQQFQQPPVQQQAPVQQFAQQPVQQQAPVQQAPAQEQFAQPFQQAPAAPQQVQQAPAADSPWTTPTTTDLAPPNLI